MNESEDFDVLINAAKLYKITANNRSRTFASMQNQPIWRICLIKIGITRKNNFQTLFWNCGRDGHISKYCTLSLHKRNAGA